jgi:hypothetical protein
MLHLAQAQSNRGPGGRKKDFPDAERLVNGPAPSHSARQQFPRSCVRFVVPPAIVFRVSGFGPALAASVTGAVVGDYSFVAPVGHVTVRKNATLNQFAGLHMLPQVMSL